jgi:chromosome segregation ATPase
MSNPPPELAAAAKRIAALEADVANLRRGMVQQLTATGRLVQQALALDEKQFGGRFLSGRQPNPQEELVIAADILAAAATELEKRGSGAGSGAPAVAGTAMTEVLRSELVAREGELAELRRQTRELQEEHAAIVAGLRTRAEQAEERAAAAIAGANSDSEAVLRADRAEALGLCSELLRVIQTAPAGGDDVQITCGVLQDALKEEGGLGMVCQAAESALVSWAEALVEALGQAKAATAGLDGLRATAGEWQKQAAQLKAELDKTRAEAAKAIAEGKSTAERSGIIEREITKLQAERETLVRDVERLQVELGEQRRAAHEANMARTRDRQETEAYRAKAKDESDQTMARAAADVAAANQRAEQAIAERDQLQGRVSNAQERVDRLEAERERAAAELAALRRELDAARAGSESVQTQAAQANQQLQALQNEAATLRKELAAARAEADAAAARDRSGSERTAKLQTERDQLVAERERALAEVGTLRRDLEQVRTEREALQAKAAAQAKQVEAAALDRDRAQGERERLDIELAQVRKELEAARAANERTAGERDTLRSRITAADGTAEAAMRERDQARSQIANAAAERDRFRAALEAAQEERTALARAKDELAQQMTLRLTESSRQLGELKQVQARLASENDRLSSENELLNKAAERGKTDVAEMKRRAEAAAQDRRRLEDAETKAVAAENRIAEIERRSQAALAERDAQIAQAVMEIKRLGEEVDSLKKRFKQAAGLLVEARAAVEKASKDLKERDK